MQSATTTLSRPSQRRGFTLVEIMVVVVIIGLIATLAFPTILMSRSNARSAGFINDLRQARSIFEGFAMETGNYPDDAQPGVLPVGLSTELDPVHWTETTPLGGQWDWDFNQFGFVAGVSVYQPDATESESIFAISDSVASGW